MAKHKAKECKNFDGTKVGPYGELWFLERCTTLHCVDRENCNGEVERETPEVHFEPK